VVDSASDLERATAQSPGLERFMGSSYQYIDSPIFRPGARRRYRHGVSPRIALSRDRTDLPRSGGIFRDLLYHALAPTRCRLRADPVREVTRLHNKRAVKRAGFVDAP
jgi:hypothetical protein